MTIKNLLKIFVTTLFFFSADCCDATVCGKADVGVTYAEIDIIYNGTVDQDLSLLGISANATFVLTDCAVNGLCLKPKILYAEGDGKYFTVAGCLGWYIPYKCFSVTPYVGVGYGELDTKGDVAMLGLSNTKKQYDSNKKSIGGDFTASPNDKWLLSLSIEYGWVDTTTTIPALPAPLPTKSKTQSRGFNYTAAVDYFITEKVSINVAGAIMDSMSKEKNGTKAKGFRVGLGRCF